MKTTHKKIIFCVISSFVLASCSPTDHKEKQVEQKQMEENKAPVVSPVPPVPEKKHTEGLTPQEKLKIDEDNVDNPVPG